jgi:selenocysteine-specific elongation factor
MTRIVMATAGHVDHGKTSLILALTGTDTDRLPDEKRRGISIELGFAELLPHEISFVDVPGHEKLVHAMIAGVGGVDAVLCVVAADDGVMPQTREHLCICSLLGIRNVVVALTKADLVDEETLALCEEDARATLDALGFQVHAFVPTSVTTRRGIDELKNALGALARSLPPRDESQRVWLPIDRAFSIKGAGTVITGTLTRGSLSVGQRLFIANENGLVETACKGLEVHGHSVEVARAPTRVAVNLARVEVAEVPRGSVVTNDGELPVSRRIDIAFRRVPGPERPLKERSPVQVYAGTTRRTGRVFTLSDGIAHVTLDEPLPCQGGVGVVLRGFSSKREWGAVLGGGRVLDADAPPLPKKRNVEDRALRAEQDQAARDGAWPSAIGHALRLSTPRPLSARAFERRFGLEPGDAVKRLTAKKSTISALALEGGDLFTIADNVSKHVELAIAHVAEHHAKHPAEPGLQLETLRAKLGERVGRELADAAIGRAKAARRVRVDGNVVALPEFAESQGPTAERRAEGVLAALREAGLAGMSEAALRHALPDEPADAVHATLGKLSVTGSARRLSELWFAESALAKLRVQVTDLLTRQERMSVNDFKQIAGVGRKQAIPLLEQLDREGLTRRQGDDRVLGARGRTSESPR